jgi:hypothetical protein
MIKKILLSIFVTMIGLAFISCGDGGSSSNPAGTIEVGEQQGTPAQGNPGQVVSFEVTTTNITSGSAITLNSATAGISLEPEVQLTTDNDTLITIGITPAIQQGEYPLTLTIGRVTSAPFTLTVSGPDAKNVTVGSQIGDLTEETGGSVTFAVTTTINILPGSTIAFLDPAAATAKGISLETTATTGNVTTVTISTTAATPPGLHSLQLVISETPSNSFNLNVTALPRTIMVSAQTGGLSIGTGGTANFTVTTLNIANGSTITLNNPSNVTGINLVTPATTTGNSTPIQITTTNDTPAGEHSLTLSIGTINSNTFNLIVRSVSVGEQSGAFLIEGTAGAARFNVTTIGIPIGQTITVNNTNLVPGISIAPATQNLTSASMDITINTTVETPEGTHPLSLSIDGVTSASFTLTVLDSITKIILVGAQSRALIATAGGSVTFPVATANITPGGSQTITLNNTSAVTGISLVTQNLTSTNMNITINTTTATPEGSHTLSLTIDGETSDPFTLVMAPVSGTQDLGFFAGWPDANPPTTNNTFAPAIVTLTPNSAWGDPGTADWLGLDVTGGEWIGVVVKFSEPTPAQIRFGCWHHSHTVTGNNGFAGASQDPFVPIGATEAVLYFNQAHLALGSGLTRVFLQNTTSSSVTVHVSEFYLVK